LAIQDWGNNFLTHIGPLIQGLGVRSSNLVGACKAKSNLLKELDVEFEEEMEWEEFLNLCDFPN